MDAERNFCNPTFIYSALRRRINACCCFAAQLGRCRQRIFTCVFCSAASAFSRHAKVTKPTGCQKEKYIFYYSTVARKLSN